MEPVSKQQLNSTVIITNRFAEKRASNVETPRATPGDYLDPGTKLGRYLIVSPLGGGGMGIVYKAQDTELDRTVALKILPPHLCQHPDALARFRAEAQAQARLNSPHVVLLYSMMESSAGEVLVLEHVEGHTLEQLIRGQGPLSVPRAVRLVEQVLAGMEHIHEMGVVHRDLKPSNIFVTPNGAIKISDFGVAKLMGANADPRGAMVGTLLYMSPEQINGQDTDFRSDIYTLGVTLFETVTGRLPFQRRTDYALMHAHVQESPPRPQQFMSDVPPALEWVILKAIEKDPNRRFQSAVEFRAAMLKLGLVERREGRERGTRRAVNTNALQQELLRYRLIPRMRRRLSGLWFDAALVASAFALILGLTLYPITDKPSEPVADAKPARAAKKEIKASTAPAKPKAIAKTPAPAPAPRRVETPPPAPPKPAAAAAPKKAPSKDGYDALRKAWGG